MTEEDVWYTYLLNRYTRNHSQIEHEKQFQKLSVVYPHVFPEIVFSVTVNI